jgi:iron complex outermembrane receptor protein
MGDTELYPKSDKLNFLGRAVLQLNADHQLYAEIAASQARTYYVGSGARVTGYIDASRIPQLAKYGLETLTDDDVPGQLTLRMRLNEAGNRTSELTSSGQRYLVGMTGVMAGWDYDLGLNHSINTVEDKDTHGYVLYDKLLAGIANGLINPFGPSSAAGVALLNSIQVNDVVRRARGSMDALDFKASRALMAMDGGSMMMAIGGELRREHTEFTPSALLMSDNINNDAAPEGGMATADSRRAGALYGELLMPFARGWEAQLSMRQDHYESVGSATSPKLGLRYLPSKELLLRASVGAGFRAPSMTDLHRPTVYSSTATLPDPVYCATVDNDLSACADNWNTRRYSNANLKPEHSQQFSAGFVLEPNKYWTASLDYWNIQRTDLISEIGDDVILGNLAKYGNLVHRTADGLIDYIELHKENRGAQKVSGLDLTADLHSVKTAIGQFGAHLNGTLVLSSRLQASPGDAYISNLGKFVTEGVVQRWRHRVTLDWEQGPLSLSLSNSFSSAYDDQNSAINIDNGSIVAANRVKAYSLWDMSGAWALSKQLKLRAGMQNLANTAPPFSNQSYFFLSGYDPSYTDPRGRFIYISAQYQFR